MAWNQPGNDGQDRDPWEAAIKAATLAGTKVVENVGLMISTISFVN